MNSTSSNCDNHEHLPNRQRGRDYAQLVVSVLLSFLMFLLFTNIMFMWLAKSYNSRVCLDAIRAGARAASEGADDEIVLKVVEYAVDTASRPGLFIARPELHSVKFGSLRGAKCLMVSTVTKAKVPAPLLVFGGSEADHGFVIFSKTYVMNLIDNAKNPKV